MTQEYQIAGVLPGINAITSVVHLSKTGKLELGVEGNDTLILTSQEAAIEAFDRINRQFLLNQDWPHGNVYLQLIEDRYQRMDGPNEEWMGRNIVLEKVVEA